ncbi:MAG: PKD-like domain-containing protein, partial [Bacteroidales bacterium]
MKRILLVNNFEVKSKVDFRGFIVVFAMFFLFANHFSLNAQNCSVNAGIYEEVCENEKLFLYGERTGLWPGGSVTTWSQVAGPSVIIVDPHALTTEVIGISGGNDSIDYRFRISSKCLDGSLVYQDVVKRVYRITPANAGSGFTSCPGTDIGGLSANNPGTNETGQWRIVGNNNAGVSFANANDPESKINLEAGRCGSSKLVWQIINDNGCTSQDTIEIFNRGVDPNISAGPDQELSHCYSTTQSTNLAGSFGGCGIDGQHGVWTVISGPNIPIIVNPDSNNTVVRNLIEGTYRFRWTVSGSCVSGYDEVKITVPAPTADITRADAGSNQVFCDSRTSTVLNGNAPLYINETIKWEQTGGPGGVTIISPTSPVTQVTGLDGLSTYTFRYTITNSVTNCSSTETVTVSYLDDAPSLFITQKPILLPCGSTVAEVPFISSGSGVNQYRIFNGPEGVFTYPTEWTSSGGTSPAIIPNLTDPGEYHIQMRRYTAVNVGCESAFDDVVVTVSIEGVEANAGTPQILNCNVTSTTLAGNDAGPHYCHTWSQVGGPIQVILRDVHDKDLGIDGLEPGLYTFRWCISGGPMCENKSSETTVLVSNEEPEAKGAGDPQIVCYGSPVFLNAKPKNFVFEVGTWSVEPNEGVMISDIFDPNAVVTGLQANTEYLFSWTVTNGCGSATSTVTVTVSDDLGPGMADAGSDICVTVGQTTATLSANAPQSGETGTWSFVSIPDGATTPTFSPNENNHQAVISELEEGTYILEWVLNTDNACKPTRDTVLVTVADITEAHVCKNIWACSSEFQLVGNDPAAGESGLWTQISGQGGAQIVSPTFSTTVVKYAPDGVYTFRWTITNGACMSYDDVKVFVSDNPPSTATITLANDVCGQTTNTLKAEEPTAGNGKWSPVSGPNTPVFTNPNSHETQVTGLITGEYVVKWTVEGGLFCDPSVATVSFTVVEKANAGANQAYCDEITAVNLTGNATSEGTWSVVSMPGGVLTVTITTTSDNSAVASGLSPGTDPEKGTYVFRYTISANGCESHDDMEVTLWHPPSVAAAGDDQELCDESIFDLQATPPDFGAGTWTKLFGPESGDFTDANDPETTYTGAEPGVYVFEWTVANGDCSNADQVRIENYAKPSLSDAGDDQDLVCSTETIMAGNDPEIGVGTWTLTAQSPTTPPPTIVSPILYNTLVTGLGPQSDGSPGVYTFSWTISNGSVCTPTISYTSITVYQIPTPAVAGPDQEFCGQISTTLSADKVDVGTGTWTVISKPDGAGDPVFTPDKNTHDAVISNLGYGVYVLEWETKTEYCTSTDTMTITNYEEPSDADAGKDAVICQYDDLFLNATPPDVGIGEWYVLPGGPNTPFIIDKNSPTTQVLGTITGTYKFVWTVSNDGCATKSSTVTITINQEPELAVIEGGNRDLCDGVTSVELEGNVPESFATGTWTVISIDPPGVNTPTFNNEHDPTTNINGLITGSPRKYTIRWTVANGICVKYDEIELRNWVPLTDPNAGADQVVCDVGTVTLTANTPVVGTGEWQFKAGPNTPDIVNTYSSTTTVTGLIPGTYTFSWVISATEGPCEPKTDDVRIINRSPIIITVPADIAVCVGAEPDLVASASGGSGTYTYQWQQSDNDCSGTWNDIPSATSYTYTAVGLATGTYYYRVIVRDTDPFACESVSDCVTVTVVKDPEIDTQPEDDEICVGGSAAFSVTASGGTPALDYQWQYYNGASWNNVVNGTPTHVTYQNATTATLGITTGNNVTSGSYQYRALVSATGLDCNTIGTITATLKIVPDPEINTQPVGDELCSGSTHTMNIVATGHASSPVKYQWQTRIPPTTSWTNVGTNTNTYTTPVLTATAPDITEIEYSVVLTQTESGCRKRSNEVTVKVHPFPAVTSSDKHLICNNTTLNYNITSDVPNTTFTWTAAQTVAPAGGAVTGFIDCISSCGSEINHILTNSGTSPGVVEYYITPTGDDPTNCEGKTFTLTVTVQPTPVALATPTFTTICDKAVTNIQLGTTNSDTTPAVTYTWEASSVELTPGVHFTQSCDDNCGELIEEIIHNPLTHPITITYTITPWIGDCEGSPVSVTLTVNPSAQVDKPGDMVLCHDEYSVGVGFTTDRTPGSTTYTWEIDNDDIWDLGLSGNGNIPGFTASNTTTSPLTRTVRVIPHYTYNGVECQGDFKEFTITVNPLGQVDKPDNQIVCHDDPTSVTFLSVNTGGTTTYEWKHINPAIGLAASGNGDISFDAINNTTAPVSSTFTVTPTFTNSGKSCTGPSEEFVIWVNPAGQVNEIDHQRLCNGETTIPVVFETNNTGGTTTYAWTNNTTSIGLAASGDGEIPSFTAVNNGNTPVVATITVIPTFENGGTSCEGESKEFTITVDPTPVVTSPSSITICSDENVNYQITSNVEGTTFIWTAQNTVGTVTGWPSGVVTGTYINDLLTNIDEADGVVIYSIKPIGPDPLNCGGPPFYLEVNVVNCNPVIGVAKQLVNVTNNGDGTHDVKFNIRVQNYGNVQLYDIQVSEDLDNIFGPDNYEVLELYSTSFDVNMAYTGTAPDTLLLNNGGTSNILDPGASTNIVLNLRILSAGEYENSVFATGESIGGTVTDTSQNGSDPDPDGDEDPTNNNDPTPVVLEDCDLSIDCPVGSPYIFNVTPGYCGYLVPDNSLDATAQTNCDLVSLRHDFGACCYHTLEDKLLPVGKTDIIWTARDASGNVKTCTITITVIDNEPPEFINCPQGNEITVSLFPGVCEGGANWSIPVAVDNCGEVTVTQTQGPAPGSVNTVGEHLIEYTARDASNNIATCTFTLKIIDTEGPVIVCPGNIFVEVTNNFCTWVSPAGSLTPLLANSNCPATVSYVITGATTASGANDASGVVFNIGTSEVTYTIT